MVPNGWNQTRLENIAKIKSGSTPLRAKQDLYFSENGTPWVKTLDLNNSEIIKTDERITELALKETSCSILPTNTVLVAMYGGFNQIGRTGLLMQPSAINQALSGLILNLEIADPKYVLNYLNGNVEQWKRYAASSRKDPNITRQDICSFEILLPPLPEQQKIAKILSTWDKAISTTERLIDNSTQQKKALMQQLLTGKKRLLDESGKRFEGEWEEVNLGDLTKYQKGYTYKSSEYSEKKTNYGFLTLKSILRGGGYSASGIKYLLASVDEKFAVESGDVVFAVTDLTRNAEVVGAPIFVPELEFEKAYISMDLIKLEIKPSVDKLFIYYLLQTAANRNFMRARASGSTVLHLDVKGSKKLKLLMPQLVIEQKRIAAVLTNADQEIELLEQQLADLQQEKKALMQVLLTGKKRVVVDS